MDVFFENQKGSSFCIELGNFDTVLDIKKKIKKYKGIPVSKQTLYFDGKVLLQDNLDVKQCNILHNSRIAIFVSPFRNHDLNSDKLLLQSEKSSPVTSNSIGDIIYGQDLPSTTQHFSDIEAFCPVKIEESSKIRDSLVRNNEKTCLQDLTLLKTEQSPPLNSAEQLINVQDSPVKSNNKNHQELGTEKSPPLNSGEQLMNVRDLNVKVVRSNKKKSPESAMPYRILERITVYVLSHSGESKHATKIPVEVNSKGNVQELRNELVKLAQKGQLKLPQKGYFCVHEHRVMHEDRSFQCYSVFPGDTIEIFPGKLL